MDMSDNDIFNSMKIVINYVKGKKELGLNINEEENNEWTIEEHSDADW